MSKPTESDCFLTSWPVCPACGNVEDGAWEWGLDDGDCEVFTCGRCDTDFEVAMRVDVAYTTSPVDGWPPPPSPEPRWHCKCSAANIPAYLENCDRCGAHRSRGEWTAADISSARGLDGP